MNEHALSGVRVVECGDLVAAPYASKLLADLGAEVIKVEPLAGDSSRRRGPFPGGRPDPNASGLYIYLNTNKRSITLDLTTTRGRELFGTLIDRADIFVHNAPPAEMASLGFDYDRFAARNPRLVMTSITPFGLVGPHREYAATDMILWNAGGIAYLNGGGPGTEAMPPLKTFGHQSEFQGGVNAAVATLGALYAAARDGQGQHVSVSIQECLAAILELTFEYWPYMGLVASRLGVKPIQPLDFMECADGWIFLCCIEEHQWRSFVELMGNPEWAAMELFENRLTRAANWDALKLMLQDWVKEQRVDELYRAAQQRRIPFAPVSTMGDLLRSEHLRARGFFATVAQPTVGPVTVPGAPYHFSQTPWTLRSPAPTLGEHTDAVLTGDLHLTPHEVDALRSERVV
ncbi:MAG TPA: CoA transferase [Candidatus Binatia bacterium]|nr:CoA transferase [Candidatus Binatia bacterium]